MPSPSLEASRLNTNIDLTCAGNSPELRDAVVKLVLELQRSGFKGDLDIVLRAPHEGDPQSGPRVKKAPIGGSPEDWRQNQDQMTVGERAGDSLVWQ